MPETSLSLKPMLTGYILQWITVSTVNDKIAKKKKRLDLWKCSLSLLATILSQGLLCHYRLLNNPSLMALGLSVCCEIIMTSNWDCMVSWSQYRLEYSLSALDYGSAAMCNGLIWKLAISKANACHWDCARKLWNSLTTSSIHQVK